MNGALRLAAVAALLTVPQVAGAAEVRGPARVIDGQTIEVKGQRLRLYGIAAPALESDCEIAGKRLACGRISRSALMDLTAGTTIECEPVVGAADVAVCRADGYCLSEGMTYTGWARADTAVTDRYLRFEEDARRRHRGLWRRAKDD